MIELLLVDLPVYRLTERFLLLETDVPAAVVPLCYAGAAPFIYPSLQVHGE